MIVARIRVAGGQEAELTAAGEWHCVDKDLEALLTSLSRDIPETLAYYPTPSHAIIGAVKDTLPLKVIFDRMTVESKPGRIY